MKEKIKYLLKLYYLEYRKIQPNRATAILSRLGLHKSCQDFNQFDNEFDEVFARNPYTFNTIYKISTVLNQIKISKTLHASELIRLFLATCRKAWQTAQSYHIVDFNTIYYNLTKNV